MKFYLSTNGCEVIFSELEKVRDSLLNLGIEETLENSDADLVVFFSCTFTSQREKDSQSITENLQTNFQNAELFIISGCFLKKDISSPMYIYSRWNNVAAEVKNYLNKQGKTIEQYQAKRKISSSPFISISRGCYGACSFCSIISVKGRHASRNKYEILKNIELVTKDYHTVKLVGDEVAGYGMDNDSSLEDLLTLIFNEFKGIKVELGQLNPNILKNWSKEQFNFLSNINITGNILIPVQSASNSILKKMNRFYTIEEFEKIYLQLRSLGKTELSTDIICGFPSESKYDHEQNINFLKNYSFNFVEIFMFDKQENKVAASRLYESLPLSIRKKRTYELIAQFLSDYQENHGISIENLIKNNYTPFNSNLKINYEPISQ